MSDKASRAAELPRDSRIAKIVADVTARRLAGETVTDESVLAQHAELLPELAAELKELAGVLRARRAAGAELTGSAAETRAPRAADSNAAAWRVRVHEFPGYEITREIHRGGQGIVYQAVQRGTHRDVAIKIMREGVFATNAERARFEREVRILAQLRHPNIVTIHESGTAGGNDFFVMDLIVGQPLDRYAAGINWSVEPVLRLMARVGDAVNAAHLRGIIHRDLKPSNILVDDRGEPQVLDFGLAKITDAESDVASALPPMTLTGQFVGSVPWASPEQAAGRNAVIDVRTDVYALGVIFYQMLTGVFPYDVTGDIRDVLDNIQNMPPTRPSTHRKRIDDEVETIVLKCLRKEPERRYQSAADLKRDIERYLAGEAIEAKRDRGWYMLKKTLRRYRVPLSITAAFIVSTVAFGIYMTVLYRRAVEAERLAETRFEQTRLARAAEAEQTVIAATVNRFLNEDMLGSISPEKAQGREITVREVLSQAAHKVDGAFPDQPRVEAALRTTIGNTYYNLGDYATAEPHLRRALELRAEALGDEDPETLESLNNLAVLLWKTGRRADAEALYGRALEAQQRTLGPQHESALVTRNNLAMLLQEQGKLVEAEALHRRILETQRATLGDEHERTLGSLNNLAALLQRQGKLGEATPLARQVVDTARRVLGPNDPRTLYSMVNLAYLLQEQQDYESAESLYRAALEAQRRVLGAEHADTLGTMNNLAYLLSTRGEHAEAEKLARGALEQVRRLFGDEHAQTVSLTDNLSRALLGLGRAEEAAQFAEQAYAMARRLYGAEDWRPAMHRGGWGACLTAMRQFEEAETHLLASYEDLKARLGQSRPRTLRVAKRLVELYEAWARPAQAANWRAVMDG